MLETENKDKAVQWCLWKQTDVAGGKGSDKKNESGILNESGKMEFSLYFEKDEIKAKYLCL